MAVTKDFFWAETMVVAMDHVMVERRGDKLAARSAELMAVDLVV